MQAKSNLLLHLKITIISDGKKRQDLSQYLKIRKTALISEVKSNGLCAVKTDPDIPLLFSADRHRIRKFAKSLNFPNQVLKKFDFQKDGSSRESLITD